MLVVVIKLLYINHFSIYGCRYNKLLRSFATDAPAFGKRSFFVQPKRTCLSGNRNRYGLGCRVGFGEGHDRVFGKPRNSQRQVVAHTVLVVNLNGIFAVGIESFVNAFRIVIVIR